MLILEEASKIAECNMWINERRIKSISELERAEGATSFVRQDTDLWPLQYYTALEEV